MEEFLSKFLLSVIRLSLCMGKGLEEVGCDVWGRLFCYSPGVGVHPGGLRVDWDMSFCRGKGVWGGIGPKVVVVWFGV